MKTTVFRLVVSASEDEPLAVPSTGAAVTSQPTIVTPDTGAFSGVNKMSIAQGDLDIRMIILVTLAVLVVILLIMFLIRYRKKAKIGFGGMSRKISIWTRVLSGVMAILAVCGIGKAIAVLSGEVQATEYDAFSVDSVVEVEMQLDEEEPVTACGTSRVVMNEYLSDGYNLKMLASDLELSSDSSVRISSIDEIGELKDNTWGYKVGTVDDARPIPINFVSIKDIETATQEGDTTSIDFCVMLDPSATVGVYESEISYSVEPYVVQPDPVDPDPVVPDPVDPDPTSNDYKNPVVTINGNEYMFPLAGASKDNYLHNIEGQYSVLSPMPCYGSGCHHDYDALDLGLRKKKVDGQEITSADYPDLGLEDLYYYSTGVKALAFVAGEVIDYHYYTNMVPVAYQHKCGSLTYRGVDGNEYWIGHLAYNESIHVGDKFELGDIIGEVGPPPCAQTTQAHMHIEIDGSNSGDIYNIVSSTYNALPQTRPLVSSYSEDSGSESDNPGSTAEQSDVPIGPVHAPSSDIPCDPRTIDLGVRDDAYYYGEQYSIRLCSIPNIRDLDGSFKKMMDPDYEDDGYIHVNSRVSGAFYALSEEHKKKCGNNLEATEGYRTEAMQRYFWNCYQTGSCNGGNLAAAVGYSNHQGGLAVDFNTSSYCTVDSDVAYGGVFNLGFLNRFGLKDGRYFSQTEYWHVEPAGN